MKAKHTPGPWILGDENNQHAEILIGDLVANIDRQDRYGLHMACSREEMLANARLIIAAPDLLEALESIINADDEAEAMMRKMGIPAEEPMEIFVAARAAIAKAKGEIHE